MDKNVVRVVIAEDEAMVAEIIEHLLRNTGCEVIGRAGDGARVVEIVKEKKPDVVLMDIRMPDMDGLEAARLIQAECPTPVVILSAYEDPGLLARACEAGVGAYLIKLPRQNELRRAISIAMARFADYMDTRDRFEEVTSRLGETESEKARLEREAEEARVLLRDVNHRVKNNMTLLSGLLGMLARKAEVDQSASILRDAQAKIRAMMVAYDRMYQSGNYRTMNLKHLLSQVMRDLCAAYMHRPDLIDVRLDVEEIDVRAKTGMYTALILNEMVTNSLKYAFPDERPGNIEISLRALPEGSFELVVSDDGIGVDEERLRDRSSFGMIKTLVNSIQGALESSDGGGVRHRVTIPA